ncbi:MAG: hypothetical protein ACK5NF_05130 [Bacilli bacterium]
MRIIKLFFKSKLEFILYTYILLSIVLHLIFNSYLDSDSMKNMHYYIDDPLFTFNNFFVLLLELFTSIFTISNNQFIENALKFVYNLNTDIIQILESLPLINVLVESFDWIIMYIIFIFFTIVLAFKKVFSLSIRIILMILIVYIIYCIYIQLQ